MALEDLSYWRHNVWELQLDRCPCDRDFVAYLYERGVRGRTIFHFGTGVHHLVGRLNSRLEPPNQVVAVTASPDELQSYVELIGAEREIGASYRVLLTDIYTLTPQVLPAFDLVTLFHLCEYYGPENASYAPLTDRTLLDLFLTRLRPGGRIFFYSGSNGYELAVPIIEDAVARGKMTPVEEFRSLRTYAGTSSSRTSTASIVTAPG